MSQKDKLLRRFLQRPASLRYSEVVHLLLYLGFEYVSTKGSHHKFKHANLEKELIIPVHQNDCHRHYKIAISKILTSKIL